MFLHSPERINLPPKEKASLICPYLSEKIFVKKKTNFLNKNFLYFHEKTNFLHLNEKVKVLDVKGVLNTTLLFLC